MRPNPGGTNLLCKERRGLFLAAGICAVLALFWTVSMQPVNAWGWDETMHAELPALRMVFSAQEGRWSGVLDAIQSCNFYPFVYPVVLAIAQGAFGPSEHLCRVLGTLVWCLTLFGLYLLGMEIRDRLPKNKGGPARNALPWLALIFGATCPLALAYAGTLFLEVPFACASVFAIRAWLRREGDLPEGAARRRDLAAGFWLTLCLFTKFNYGALLVAGFVLDWIIQGIVQQRKGNFPRFMLRTFWLSAIPVLFMAWWFLWPLPAGPEVGTIHRAAFLSFLGLNLDGEPEAWNLRLLFFSGYFTPTSRVCLLMMIGLLFSLRFSLESAVRIHWILLLTLGLPVTLHPFHLDRYLIPLGVPLWILAAAGWTRILPARPMHRWATIMVLALAAGLFPHADAPWMADRLQVLKIYPKIRKDQLEQITAWCDLSGRRRLPSAGPRVEESEALIDLVARAVGPEQRVGWLGAQLSPCALHFGLWKRGGSRLRFLEQAHVHLLGTLRHEPSEWTEEGLGGLADRFDVLLATAPAGTKNLPGHEFPKGYQRRLVENHGWRGEVLGDVNVPLSDQVETPIRIYIFRPD